MYNRRVKSLLILSYSIFCLLFPILVSAQHDDEHTKEVKEAKHEEKKGGFDANEVIFGHVLNAHEFHFLSYTGNDGEEHHVTIPLPVILYSPQRGLDVFMSSKFHHGHSVYKGYKPVGACFLPIPDLYFFATLIIRNTKMMSASNICTTFLVSEMSYTFTDSSIAPLSLTA